MSKKEPEPGTFIDEEGNTYRVDHGALPREMRAASARKHVLIEEALIDSKVTTQYACLLHDLRSATTSGSLADLEKVEAALSLRDELFGNFSNGRIAYVGSGYDWEFPVALGARTIDMVDAGFSDTGLLERLLGGIESVAPDAVFEVGEFPTVKFDINLGEGEEKVSLRLLGIDVTKYRPPNPLNGVLEFAGPTKGYMDDSPVFPSIAQALTPGATVVNFDFQHNTVPNSPARLTPMQVGKFIIYRAGLQENM